MTSCEHAACAASYFLVCDAAHFHVFVGGVNELQGLAQRWDWRKTSRFETKRWRHDEQQTARYAGEARVCGACLADRMETLLEKYAAKRYNLFRFNCRTVSYLLLVEALGFDADRVYALFVQERVLCGLEEGECFSLTALRQYMAYESSSEDDS